MVLATPLINNVWQICFIDDEIGQLQQRGEITFPAIIKLRAIAVFDCKYRYEYRFDGVMCFAMYSVYPLYVISLRLSHQKIHAFLNGLKSMCYKNS